MSRWEPNARGRLTQAAMELFAERGYDQVTVAEIAERAGLTERTFFRHLSDKREVLFAGSSTLLELIADSVNEAPPSAPPLDIVVSALESSVAMFEAQGVNVRVRQGIVESHPELRERELIKRAAMAEVMAEALRGRGVEDLAARVTAEAGVGIFRLAFDQWVHGEEGRDFRKLIRETADQLRAVTAGR